MLASATLLTEWASRGPVREANRIAKTRSTSLQADRRNAETTFAMGMQRALADRWLALNTAYFAAVERSADVIGFYGSLSKTMRMMLQSAALGLGAYLVIRQSLCPVR